MNDCQTFDQTCANLLVLAKAVWYTCYRKRQILGIYLCYGWIKYISGGDCAHKLCRLSSHNNLAQFCQFQPCQPSSAYLPKRTWLILTPLKTHLLSNLRCCNSGYVFRLQSQSGCDGNANHPCWRRSNHQCCTKTPPKKLISLAFQRPKTLLCCS